MDSNDDGIGDLRGIISKLDYIQDLGFETIWLSPFFSSPQQDWGYDVSDYYDVAPEYGSLDDIQALIDGVHTRGMRLLFDLVMNHTSCEHPWFRESRQSRDNPKRDWYIWRDGRGKRPPNNWKALPGGSGWHYDRATDQFYYASFLPFQPDLNYRNPEVRETMLDVARYWLDRGVDGFRLDIFHSVYKDERLRDNPFSIHYLPYNDEAGFFQRWEHQIHQPETFQLAQSLRAIADSYSPEKLLIGEVFGGDDILRKYLGDDLDGLNLVFLWDLLKPQPRARFFRRVIRHYEENYPPPYTPVYVFGNHDQKRVISKVANRPRVAKLLALLQFTVRGVPVTYYGEEIGMREGDIPAREAKDPVGQRYKWLPKFLADALGLYVNRDGCRTPMQWDDSPNAGFCRGDAAPWLPLHQSYPSVNVESQLSEGDSLYHVYRGLLRLRREIEALRMGSLQLLDADEKDLLIYRRDWGAEALFVVINFGEKAVPFWAPAGHNQVLFEIGLDGAGRFEGRALPPLSGVVLGGE